LHPLLKEKKQDSGHSIEARNTNLAASQFELASLDTAAAPKLGS
jgi:hypothetical protein